jgi:hypothetical protein
VGINPKIVPADAFQRSGFGSFPKKDFEALKQHVVVNTAQQIVLQTRRDICLDEE